MADFTGGPGLLAFIATFALVGAAILLFRSLSKHLRKVRTHPPADARAKAADDAAAGDGEGADEGTTSAPDTTSEGDASRES